MLQKRYTSYNPKPKLYTHANQTLTNSQSKYDLIINQQ